MQHKGFVVVIMTLVTAVAACTTIPPYWSAGFSQIDTPQEVVLENDVFEYPDEDSRYPVVTILAKGTYRLVMQSIDGKYFEGGGGLSVERMIGDGYTVRNRGGFFVPNEQKKAVSYWVDPASAKVWNAQGNRDLSDRWDRLPDHEILLLGKFNPENSTFLRTIVPQPTK
jgi:hypothetical protein